MAPDDQKGQVIGTMNLLNWIGILLAGGIHFASSRLLTAMNWPPATVFVVGALLLLLMTAFFRPRSQALFAESDAALAEAGAVHS
jgi:acyl-[acyl-carrier-protein]-phospholipid O-acyltransferase/long-chain-fatty-acid--[acyl-carrier-protein] ligase